MVSGRTDAPPQCINDIKLCKKNLRPSILTSEALRRRPYSVAALAVVAVAGLPAAFVVAGAAGSAPPPISVGRR